ncbi:MAG: type II secretion system F family protein [Bdellovibrionota bacterium]
MNVESINWIASLAMAAVSVFLLVSLLSALHESTTELRKQQVASGDSSLAELYISLSPEMFFMLRLVAFALAFLFGTLIFFPVIGVFFGIAGFFVPAIMLRQLRAKRVKKIELQLIEALELLGSSLKSGLTLPQATELLIREFPPPISQEFALVMAETRLGVDFTDALENMAKRLGSTIVEILATGVAITKRCGGDLSVIFSNIAQTIRERATIEGKLEAVTAQGRFQGLILGMMPFALVIILYFIDRQHVLTLFGYKLGIWAFTLVCIMVIMAQLWIRKLMQIDV